MKIKFFSMILAVFMLCGSVITVFAAQGTNGDERQVAEAQQLEIQLGTEWTGVEFMLRTDAGIYPDLIPVDENGVLSLEIGGSKTYTLSCLRSSVVASDILLLQAPVTGETEPEANASSASENHASSIPVSHIIMFAVGIVIAVGILIAISISNKKGKIVQDDEDDDDF